MAKTLIGPTTLRFDEIREKTIFNQKRKNNFFPEKSFLLGESLFKSVSSDELSNSVKVNVSNALHKG